MLRDGAEVGEVDVELVEDVLEDGRGASPGAAGNAVRARSRVLEGQQQFLELRTSEVPVGVGKWPGVGKDGC